MFTHLQIALLILISMSKTFAITNGVEVPTGQATSVVMIEDLSVGSIGTGVVIGHDVILTAEHCVGGHDIRKIRINGVPGLIEGIITENLEYVETRLDLAILKLKANRFRGEILPISTKLAAEGDLVHIMGFGPAYTKSDPVTLDERIIKRVGWNHIYKVNPTYINIEFDLDAPFDQHRPSGALPGDSGGPMILNGRVIGIASKSMFMISNYVNLANEGSAQLFTRAKKLGWDIVIK